MTFPERSVVAPIHQSELAENRLGLALAKSGRMQLELVEIQILDDPCVKIGHFT